jgi:hypothetical protein
VEGSAGGDERMRLAIFSDIHGNLEAFEAVCADISRQSADEAVCLGDMIGYGPDPDEVVRRVRDLHCRTVLGNHEASLFSERARNRMQRFGSFSPPAGLPCIFSVTPTTSSWCPGGGKTYQRYKQKKITSSPRASSPNRNYCTVMPENSTSLSGRTAPA